MAKGEVINTYADASGIWHAEIEAAEGCGEQEVYGCTVQTVRNRAARAIRAEIIQRQAQNPAPVKVDYAGMFQRGPHFIALFREH